MRPKHVVDQFQVNWLFSGFEMDNCHQDKNGTDRSDLVSEDGKNIKSVLCQRCGSKVLCPGMAAFAEKEVSL